MGKKSKRKARKVATSAAAEGTRAPPDAREPVASDQNVQLAEMLGHLEPLPLPHFAQILRGALMPNEQVKDLDTWKHDGALRESVRSMFMRKRLGAGPAHAVLARGLEERTAGWWNAEDDAVAACASGTPDPADFLQQWLLTRDEVVALFGMGARFGGSTSARPWIRATEEASMRRQTRLVDEVRMRGGTTNAWNFEDVLEAGGCNVHGLSSFNLCCEDAGIYEFLTVESVLAVARYLVARAAAAAETQVAAADAASPSTFTVLEVGAGSGRLSKLLRAALVVLDASVSASEPAARVEVIATDCDLRPHPRQKLSTTAPAADDRAAPLVHAMDYSRAIARYAPDLVLCAWMPMDTDWSAAFRRAPSVREYVLLGEAEWGVCGHNFLTWGNARFRDDGGPPGGGVVASAAERDGWKRVDLHDEVSRWLLGRYDTSVVGGTSVCVSFRRAPAIDGDVKYS
jgi:hypothetical protein